MQPLVKIQISVLAAIKREDGVYCVQCPYLNVVTHGNSERQALENLKEEIEFLFSSCESVATLVAVMDQRTSNFGAPIAEKDLVRIETTYVELPADVPPELLKRFADAARHSA